MPTPDAIFEIRVVFVRFSGLACVQLGNGSGIRGEADN